MLIWICDKMKNLNNNKQNKKRQNKTVYKIQNNLVRKLKPNQYLNVKIALKNKGKNQIVKRLKSISKNNKGAYYQSVIYEICDNVKKY